MAVSCHSGRPGVEDSASGEGSGQLHGVFIFHGGHGVGEGEEADVAAVLLQEAGDEIPRHQHTALGDFFVDGIADGGGTAAAHAGRQGLHGDARQLGIQTHGQHFRAGIALTKAGQGGVCRLDLQLEGPFTQAGILQRDLDSTLGQVFFEMPLENGGDHIVAAHSHGDGADVRRVRQRYLQGRVGRDPSGIGHDGDGRTVHILEKDVPTGNQRDQDEQAQDSGKEIFFAHGDSFLIQAGVLHVSGEFSRNSPRFDGI